MKKRVLAMLMAGLMVCSFTACSGNADKAEDKKEETTEEAKETDEKAELEDSLVIYTTHGEEMVQMIADAFTEETGVKVEFINLKGELADRVRSEKENPQADIMYGGDTATYLQLQSEDCFAPTHPEWESELDSSFKDADGYWYGTIKTPVMMFYNTEQMTAEEAPKDWSDLAKDEYKDKIITRDSLSSSMRSTICGLIYNISQNDSEDAAWDYLTKLNANTKNYYNSGSMMYEAIGKGEAAISVAVLSDITDNKDNNAMPFQEIDAESGAVTITDCIAAINNAPHPNAAAAFVEFAGSAKIQAKIANEYNRIPTLDSALPDCPEWMQTPYKAMDLDWKVISDNQSEWLDKWENEFIDASKTVAKQ